MDAHEKGFFTEENSVEVVTGRNKNAKDERLKQIMEVVTRKLHEAVKEIEPTQDEWMQAILFLTRTGQMCNEWRQEFILLSDVLGVSMLVDAINNRKPSGASESTVLGPFHVEGAPELEMGANICLDAKGEDMVIGGRIIDTAGQPINDAVIDVWQANDEGFYDVQQQESNQTSTFAACSGLAPTAATGSGRSSRNIIPFPTTDPLANCSVCSVAIPTGPPTCTTSSRPTASRRSRHTSSIRTTRTSNLTPSSV